MSDKPNVVFMLADNIGWGDLSCYGNLNPTPRLDKLASEGIRFTNFNTEAQCTPTRSALMTGRMPIRSGTFTVSPSSLVTSPAVVMRTVWWPINAPFRSIVYCNSYAPSWPVSP